MLLTLMMAASAATATEQITLDHAGRSLAARYRAELSVERKQVGAVAGARAGTRRCDWTAAVRVHRDTMAQDGTAIPALSRTLADDTAFRGSRMGECDTAAAAIDAEVARRDPHVSTHLAQAIARDRPALMAELDSLGPVMAARAR